MANDQDFQITLEHEIAAAIHRFEAAAPGRVVIDITIDRYDDLGDGARFCIGSLIQELVSVNTNKP